MSVDSILTSALAQRFLKARVISENGLCLCFVVGGIALMNDDVAFFIEFVDVHACIVGVESGGRSV